MDLNEFRGQRQKFLVLQINEGVEFKVSNGLIYGKCRQVETEINVKIFLVTLKICNKNVPVSI